MKNINFWVDETAVYVQLPYDAEFLTRMKEVIPSCDRRWDSTSKRWAFSRQSAPKVRDLIKGIYAKDVPLPGPPPQVPQVLTIRVEYLGRVKPRPDLIALGYCGGQWLYRFPVQSLYDWFQIKRSSFKTETATLYEVLGLDHACQSKEIKSAYRRLAREWHPDVCREPDATDRFRRINEAYELLSSPKRILYDLGLKTFSPPKVKPFIELDESAGYRTPYRSGLLQVEGTRFFGASLTVQKILSWEPITDGDRRLVSSWTYGATEPTFLWV